MKLIKNMEALFVVTLGFCGATSFLLGSVPEAQAQTPVAMTAPDMANVTVVVVSAKRMTAQEKLHSLNEERKLAAARAIGSHA